MKVVKILILFVICITYSRAKNNIKNKENSEMQLNMVGQII